MTTHPTDRSEQLATTEHPTKRIHLPWHPVVAVVFVVVLYFLAQIIGGVLVSLYPSIRGWAAAHAHEWLNNSVVAQFSYMLIVELLILAGVWLFLRRHKRGFRDLGLMRPKLSDPLLSVVAFGVYFIAYAVIVQIVVLLVPAFDPNQPQDIGFQNATGLVLLALTFVSLVILPPITEEILMRGFLFGSLRKKLAFVPTTLITSAIFAVGHLGGGEQGASLLWVAFLDTFILSLVLCYLREKTGRLWAPIGLHMLKNSLAFISLFILHVR